jgi:hypothetical protein
MKLWGVFALSFITKPHHRRNVGVSADLVENSWFDNHDSQLRPHVSQLGLYGANTVPLENYAINERL